MKPPKLIAATCRTSGTRSVLRDGGGLPAWSMLECLRSYWWNWEDRDTLLAVADGACGLVRPEPPVPVEHLIFRGLPAGVELGEDGVILWEPRPGGRERGFVYDTTVVARVPAGAGREDITVVGVIDREFSRRQTRCPRLLVHRQ